LAKSETSLRYQPEDDNGKTIELTYKQCSGYKHQEGWKDLVDNKGRLNTKTIEVVGPLSPGSVVRHNAFAGQTKIEEDVARVLPLFFALVGCLTLSINRGTGVLVAPDVQDLIRFAKTRPWMTPDTDRACRIASAGDAALQAQLRVRLKRIVHDEDLPGCHSATFRSTPWARQQKSRVETLIVPPGREVALDQFATALAELPPRIASHVMKDPRGRGKKKTTTERTEWFWVDSIVRPLVADNLAQGQPWYRGFVELMIKLDPVNKRPIREKLFFEKEGLHAMIEKIPWSDHGESTVVRAVHEALRRRFGQIANENKGKPAARKNRWKREYDRWRLAFAGAKTPDQFRRSICDLFSRAGINTVLQEEWKGLLPMLAENQWQLTRDLALLGLASYTATGAKENEDASTEIDESSNEESKGSVD
jgi:CRISPR-associated protein Cas8a1/Csx13